MTDSSGNGNTLTASGDATIDANWHGDLTASKVGDATSANGWYVDTPGGPVGGGRGNGNVLNLTGNTMGINLWVQMGDSVDDDPHRTRQFVSKQRIAAWDPSTEVPWDYSLWAQLALDFTEPDVYPDVPPFSYALNSYLYSSPCCAGTGFAHGNEAGELAEGQLARGEWHMLTVSIDSGMFSYYYDGQFVVNDYNEGNPWNQQFGAADGGGPEPRLWIGTHSLGNGYIRGLMDEVSIFDTALSGADVKALHIPEPSALIVLSTGLVGLLCYVRRRRK